MFCPNAAAAASWRKWPNTGDQILIICGPLTANGSISFVHLAASAFHDFNIFSPATSLCHQVFGVGCLSITLGFLITLLD